MSQLVLNDSIWQKPDDSVQLIDLELDVVISGVDVDDTVMLETDFEDFAAFSNQEFQVLSVLCQSDCAFEHRF